MRSAEFVPPHVVKAISEEQDALRDARAAADEREERYGEPPAPVQRRSPDALDVSFAKTRVAQWAARVEELRAEIAHAEAERQRAEDELATLLRGEWPRRM